MPSPDTASGTIPSKKFDLPGMATVRGLATLSGAVPASTFHSPSLPEATSSAADQSTVTSAGLAGASPSSSSAAARCFAVAVPPLALPLPGSAAGFFLEAKGSFSLAFDAKGLSSAAALASLTARLSAELGG